MRILGIDPGLQLTGYGVVDFRGLMPKLIDGGVIRFNAKKSIAHERTLTLRRNGADWTVTDDKVES